MLQFRDFNSIMQLSGPIARLVNAAIDHHQKIVEYELREIIKLAPSTLAGSQSASADDPESQLVELFSMLLQLGCELTGRTSSIIQDVDSLGRWLQRRSINLFAEQFLLFWDCPVQQFEDASLLPEYDSKTERDILSPLERVICIAAIRQDTEELRRLICNSELDIQACIEKLVKSGLLNATVTLINVAAEQSKDISRSSRLTMWSVLDDSLQSAGSERKNFRAQIDALFTRTSLLDLPLDIIFGVIPKKVELDQDNTDGSELLDSDIADDDNTGDGVPLMPLLAQPPADTKLLFDASANDTVADKEPSLASYLNASDLAAIGKVLNPGLNKSLVNLQLRSMIEMLMGELLRIQQLDSTRPAQEQRKDVWVYYLFFYLPVFAFFCMWLSHATACPKEWCDYPSPYDDKNYNYTTPGCIYPFREPRLCAPGEDGVMRPFNSYYGHTSDQLVFLLPSLLLPAFHLLIIIANRIVNLLDKDSVPDSKPDSELSSRVQSVRGQVESLETLVFSERSPIERSVRAATQSVTGFFSTRVWPMAKSIIHAKPARIGLPLDQLYARLSDLRDALPVDDDHFDDGLEETTSAAADFIV